MAQQRQRDWVIASALMTALATQAVLLPAAASAQTAAAAAVSAPASGQAPAEGQGLTIDILAGESELNDVRARTAREPIVEIQDRNHKPVAGALVLFAIDSGGGSPEATFSGLSTLSVRTGADGRAIGRGFTITKHTGNFQINVHATYQGQTADAQIHESNYSHGHNSTNRLSQLTSNKPMLFFAIEVAAFVAAATTIVVTSRDPASTTATPGNGTVTAP